MILIMMTDRKNGQESERWWRHWLCPIPGEQPSTASCDPTQSINAPHRRDWETASWECCDEEMWSRHEAPASPRPPQQHWCARPSSEDKIPMISHFTRVERKVERKDNGRLTMPHARLYLRINSPYHMQMKINTETDNAHMLKFKTLGEN